VRLAAIHGNDNLPLNPEKNTATVAARALLQYVDAGVGVELELFKKMPLGSGLGSSAASAVAAAVAVNALLEAPLPKKALLPFALEGEKAATGAAHADNVAPCLLGGLVLVRSYQPIDIISLPVPERLWCVVTHPQVEVLTKAARQAIPDEIALADAIIQWGNVAGLVAGFCQNDLALIGRSMSDVVAEPNRAGLIPHFATVKNRAVDAGALGCGISGSGPSVFALCESEAIARQVGAAMQAGFAGIESTVYVSKINRTGAELMPERRL